MHLLIAPNAFKNALPADQVAAAIQRGVARSRLPATMETFPVGDGGDGTGDLLIRHLKGQNMPVIAHGPFGQKIKTHWGLVTGSVPAFEAPADGVAQQDRATPGRIAIIEMANASGLRLLDPERLNPLQASSRGTGELICAALECEAKTIIIGMGGSATVDGGAGILQSLGARFLDRSGQTLNDLPAELASLHSIDTSAIHHRLGETELIVLCDVENPLTGPNGAAAIFGPQKGASPDAVRQLEAGLRQFASVVAGQTGKDITALARGGTAGGAAAGLYGLLSARLVSGIDYFLDITNFNAALDRSTVVITGEGNIDDQTLEGKAPFGVALRAQTHGIPVIAFTGKTPSNPYPLHLVFDQIISINPAEIELKEALEETADNLERTAMEWANRVAASL